MSSSKKTIEPVQTDEKLEAFAVKAKRKIDFIVVHCTATLESAAVESIKKYWRENLGWKDPGYHYLVDAWGVVHQLASEESITNGVKGFNSNSIHVSYIGGVDRLGKALDTRNTHQKQSIFFLLQTLRTRYPDAVIQGHRDFSEDKNGNGVIDPWERIKECPCFDAKVEYQFI